MRKCFLYVIVISFSIISCKQVNKKIGYKRLTYDLYVEDSLLRKAALVIEYSDLHNDSFYTVTIKSDTLKLKFFEKVANNGIYRSFDSVHFSLTHAFAINKKVESDLGKQYPIFINNWVTKTANRKYLYSSDSMSICFFDETLIFYSVTGSYYSRDFNAFALYYLPSKQQYYKLAKVEGLSLKEEKMLLAIGDKVLNDTFFLNYYKQPKVAGVFHKVCQVRFDRVFVLKVG